MAQLSEAAQDRTSVDETVDDAVDEAWLKTLDSAGSREFRRRFLKDVVLGAVALVCLLGFVNYPQSWVVIGGVAMVVVVAWASETKSSRATERWPACGRVIVVTGCDSGFGHLLALHLDRLGANVFAGCRDAEGSGATRLTTSGSERLHVLQMDITDKTQVALCVESVTKATNGAGIWGLVNNAGLNFVGDIELTTMDQFTNITNINQLGMVRVTKAFLPSIRKRQGRIVNVTSVKGRIAEPFIAAYAMTKFATEAFSDVLRLEMKKFGVHVSIIEPGNFGGATECLNMDRIRGDFETMWTSLPMDQRETYGRHYVDHHLSSVEAARPTASFDLAPVIDAMTDALFAISPRARYLVPGGSGRYDVYRWRILIQPFLPTWLMDRWLLRDIRHFPRPVAQHFEDSD